MPSRTGVNPWGFTNDVRQYEAVHAYREAAIADGWTIRPTYPGHEPQERVASLEREGYGMMVFSRTDVGKWRYEARVYLWGPDALAIEPRETYDMAAIIEGAKTCGYCGAVVDVTTRVAFAGRACEACAPEAKRREEYPGWCN